ncbi:uncharacterized protein LOC126894429 isoform X3 [Daktulosphaira vitifoliae]|uniref:uncharacterized protein LOC126894429 isoform X3 n=1 Tax=Daktulosphaira vitifoliae TaxID=58002 RepID=UPI0021AAF509|nr:uncharacterized protein LOC126894429 isoform X3 [Daktulosphaira vitifoliae]
MIYFILNLFELILFCFNHCNMTFQISMVFIILCGLISLMASPSTKENNEKASSSTSDVELKKIYSELKEISNQSDVELKKVYSELKEISNQVITKYSSIKNYEGYVHAAKNNTDHTIVRAMILNEYESVKKVINYCKKLEDKLDLKDYVNQLFGIMLEKIYRQSSLMCFLPNNKILKKIFEYYSNDSNFISKSVFLDFLNNEKLLDETDKSYHNIVDQLDLQSFSILMEPHLPKYLENLTVEQCTLEEYLNMLTD